MTLICNIQICSSAVRLTVRGYDGADHKVNSINANLKNFLRGVGVAAVVGRSVQRSGQCSFRFCRTLTRCTELATAKLIVDDWA